MMNFILFGRETCLLQAELTKRPFEAQMEAQELFHIRAKKPTVPHSSHALVPKPSTQLSLI
jgi:hypothetical protein